MKLLPGVRWLVPVVTLAVACSPSSERADTASSLLAIDTIKPAPTSLTAGSTTAVDTTATSSTAGQATKTRSPAAASATKQSQTKQGQTKELGRDSIIRFDTKDKRRQLPPADTNRQP
jgi:hypothetical protein